MKILQGVNEHEAIVVIDNTSFINCNFTKCKVVYQGGDFACLNTNFKECQLMLQGSAAKTAQLLGFFGWKPGDMVPVEVEKGSVQ